MAEEAGIHIQRRGFNHDGILAGGTMMFLGGGAEAATNERSLNLKDGSVRSRRAGFVLHNQ